MGTAVLGAAPHLPKPLLVSPAAWVQCPRLGASLSAGLGSVILFLGGTPPYRGHFVAFALPGLSSPSLCLSFRQTDNFREGVCLLLPHVLPGAWHCSSVRAHGPQDPANTPRGPSTPAWAIRPPIRSFAGPVREGGLCLLHQARVPGCRWLGVCPSVPRPVLPPLSGCPSLSLSPGWPRAP